MTFIYLQFICCWNSSRIVFEVMGYVCIGGVADKQCQKTPKKIKLLTTSMCFSGEDLFVVDHISHCS